MLGEVLDILRPKPGGRYVDGTIGGAGHAAEMLERSSPDGWLFGCDRDAAAIAASGKRLEPYAGRYELRQGNLATLAEWVAGESCDGVFFDLGVSSPQFDQGERGFSLMHDGPLDMRMDRNQALTAADLVNGAEVEELARILAEYGGQRGARGLARAIARERQRTPFARTLQLAQFIERIYPRGGRRVHPATNAFLALRVAVNDELGALRRGLAGALRILRPGGRLAVITFHSAEDRLVKEFGREQTRDYAVAGAVDLPEFRQPRPPRMKWVQRKAARAGERELRENPRSRSAQLRALEKL